VKAVSARLSDGLGRLGGLILPLAVLGAASLLAALREGGLAAFYLGPFSSAYAFGNMLENAAILGTAALGAAISLRAGAVNLGGDGQFYSGALAGHVILTWVRGFPAPAAAPLAWAGAFLAGSLLGALPALLKRRGGADELITSFLSSAALIPCLDWIVAGPLKDPDSQLIATRAIDPALSFTRLLPPSSLSAAALAAAALTALGWIGYWRTRAGFRLRMSGAAPDFAEAAGLEPRRIRFAAMVLGAGIIGLAGVWAVMGRSPRVFQNFSGGMGFTALACAITARLSPALVLPAALFFAFLEAGAKSAQILSGMTAQASSMLQALVLLAMAAASGRGRRKS